ncbi:organic cation transporter protein-like [Drosophila innubila]|uniref:organic cation transporter protein-like n=1 Tax=Drosophila innubila TaxID=198719 RepID=UPI00148CB8A6|nr:organic cation transporter protein-like [Drosophila innubila]
MVLVSTFAPTAFLLAMELVSSKHRVMAVMVLTLTSGLAGTALGYLAGYILDWRLLLRVIYIPGLLHLIILCWLPESIPWLLSQSKEEEVIQILREIARVNKRPLPEEQLKELRRNNRQVVTQSEAHDGHYSLRQIFDALGLRIYLCCFVWFSSLLIGLGLILNLNDLSGNKFRNYSLTSFLDLPGILIAALLMNRIGRRWAMSLFMGSCSTLLIAITILDMDYPNMSWYLYFLAKMASTCNFITLYFVTAEIFPTHCRNSMLSLCAMVGSFGYMLAPQTPLLADFFKYAPHFLFATFALINSGLVMFFPETAKKGLPTTLEEARVQDRKMPLKHLNVAENSKTSV